MSAQVGSSIWSGRDGFHALSEEIEKAAGGVLPDIESNIAKLAAFGIKQEICAVATRVFGVDNTTLLPGLSLVGDGFISLIGYQAQGYHLVPVF